MNWVQSATLLEFAMRPKLFSLMLAAAGVYFLSACGQPSVSDRYGQTPYLALTGIQTQVARLDVARMRRLKIYKPLRELVFRDEEVARWWSVLSGHLGFDPLGRVEKIVVGIHGDWNSEDPLAGAVTILTGDFGDRQALLDGVLAFLAEEYIFDPPPFSPVAHGEAVIYSTSASTHPDPDKILQFHLGFSGERVVIFARKVDYVRNCLDVIAGQEPSITERARWKSLQIGPPLTNSMFWSAGGFPAELKQWLSERIASEPELAGLNGLLNGGSYSLFLNAGKQYRMVLSIICDDINQAAEIRDDLEKARPVLPRLLAHIYGAESGRIEQWMELLEGLYSSNEINVAKVTLRKDRPRIQEFVRHLSSALPTPAPFEIPAPFLPPESR